MIEFYKDIDFALFKKVYIGAERYNAVKRNPYTKQQRYARERRRPYSRNIENISTNCAIPL